MEKRFFIFRVTCTPISGAGGVGHGWEDDKSAYAFTFDSAKLEMQEKYSNNKQFTFSFRFVAVI